eukprot:5923895-Alexandrium_andersonii.AAC.1
MLAKTDSGDQQAQLWKSPFFQESRYQRQEQSLDTVQELLPWGVMAGKHSSEEAAVAALARGEIEEVENLSGIGPQTLFRTVVVKCTRDWGRHTLQTRLQLRHHTSPDH